MGLKLKPIVKRVNNEIDFWASFVSIIQSVLPSKRRLTGSELKVFSYVLAQDMNRDQFRGVAKNKTMENLKLNIHSLGMHRSNIAKKGWIVDKLPERFIRSVQKEMKPIIEANPDEVIELEITFTIRLDGRTGEAGS